MRLVCYKLQWLVPTSCVEILLCQQAFFAVFMKASEEYRLDTLLSKGLLPWWSLSSSLFMRNRLFVKTSFLLSTLLMEHYMDQYFLPSSSLPTLMTCLGASCLMVSNNNADD